MAPPLRGLPPVATPEPSSGTSALERYTATGAVRGVPVIVQTHGPRSLEAHASDSDHVAASPPTPTAGIPPVLGQKPSAARWLAQWVPPQVVLTVQQALSYAGVGALASGAKMFFEGTPAPYLIDMHYIERLPHVALVGFAMGMLMNGIRLPDELLKKVPAEYRHHFAGVLTAEEKKLPAAQQMLLLSYRAGLIGEFIFTKTRWQNEILPIIQGPKYREVLNFMGLRRSGQAIALGGELLVTTIYVPILFKLGIGLDMSWQAAAVAGFDIGLFGSYIATLINMSATPATQPEANLERQKNFGILNSLATTAALFPREWSLPALFLASGLRYGQVFRNRDALKEKLSPESQPAVQAAVPSNDLTSSSPAAK